MPSSPPAPVPCRPWLSPALWFGCVLMAHAAFLSVGWRHEWLPGHEFRQTQTALSALFIQREATFTVAYPTPAFGKPWSVPLEFPLYQWSVVATSNLFDLPLVQAARTISALSFHLCLPALFLLLGFANVDVGRRWLALGFILSSPLYIFYSRAFLIESLALMLSLWFLVGFVGWLRSGRTGWLVLCIVLGSAAAVTKVTTLTIYLLGAAGVAGWLALRSWDRAHPNISAKILLKALLAVALPIGLGTAWVFYSDAIKAQNPGADFLLSTAARPFTLGAWSLRVAPSFWSTVFKHWNAVLLPWWGAALALLATLVAARRHLPLVGTLLALFIAAQLVFSNLYLLHDYYLYANGLLLLLAAGIGVAGLIADSPRLWLRVGGWLLASAIVVTQLSVYRRSFIPMQQLDIPGGGEHTQLLRTLTDPDDVIVVVGDDWSPVIPYYAERRALMLPVFRENDASYLAQAFANLAEERIGALVIKASSRAHKTILARAEQTFRILPIPVFSFKNDLIFYFHEDLQDRVDAHLAQVPLETFHDLRAVPPAPVPSPFALHELTVAALDDQSAFGSMTPRPSLLRTPLPKPAAAHVEGSLRFNAHAPTELVFPLQPGRRKLYLEYGLADQTYGHAEGPNTDGVQFVVLVRRPRRADRVLHDVHVDPHQNSAHRGPQVANVEFDAPFGAELVLQAMPGPSNNNAYDWSYWGRIELR